MLPETKEDLKQFKLITQPSYTYKLDIEKEKVRGYTDNLEAVKQAVYKILNTERYHNIIYSWKYGVELAELFGRSKDYVISEIPRRVREALVQDDRIERVENFSFVNGTHRGSLLVYFEVTSAEGVFQSGLEVRYSV